jgi:hypothetical protein
VLAKEKLWITSLNSHFSHLRLSTKYGEYSEVAKVWIYVIHSLGDQPELQIITPTLTLGSSKYVEHMLTI